MATLVSNDNPPNLVDLPKLWDGYLHPEVRANQFKYKQTNKGAMAVDPIPNGSLPSLVRLFSKLWDEYIPPEKD